MTGSGKTWEQARERMKGYLDAVFWQDFGIEGDEKEKYMNWILDRIVRPEFMEVLGLANWSVWRQDDNGNRFEVLSGLSRAAAESAQLELENSAHKQTYWIESTPPDDVAAEGK